MSDNLGPSVYPHVEVDNKTGDCVYHFGIQMWPWFLGQSLAGGNSFDQAVRYADLAMKEYQERATPQAPEVKPLQEWKYFGVIPNRKGVDFYVWQRIHERKPQCACTTDKSIPPGPDSRVFGSLRDMAAFHLIGLEQMEEFVRQYVRGPGKAAQ